MKISYFFGLRNLALIDFSFCYRTLKKMQFKKFTEKKSLREPFFNSIESWRVFRNCLIFYYFLAFQRWKSNSLILHKHFEKIFESHNYRLKHVNHINFWMNMSDLQCCFFSTKKYFFLILNINKMNNSYFNDFSWKKVSY